MTRLKRIALLLESDMAFDRAIARGVGDYVHTHKGWLVMMDPVMEFTVETLRHWEPDGIISSVNLARRGGLCLPGVPAVVVGSSNDGQEQSLGVPVISSNHLEIGRMAARYFISKGFKNFAFCGGLESGGWCALRRMGFQEELAAGGFDLSVYEPDLAQPVSMPQAVASLGRWLRTLPKPTAVFAFFDGWARWVLDACLLEEIAVPHTVAVLGVDDDRWLCELSQPSLSSVDPNVVTTGFIAAKLLDGMLRGETPPPFTLIDPAEVKERDSSNVMAFEQSEVAIAMRYIREHACDPIEPADVLAVTGMSNSTAYRRFMKEVGHSIHTEIQRVQMERVRALLTTTNLSVTEIGRQTGFENVRYLTKVFREAVGCTPMQFRRTQGTAKV